MPIPAFKVFPEQVDWKNLSPFLIFSFDEAEGDYTRAEELKSLVSHEFWLPQKDETWESKLLGGKFILYNFSDPKAIRYKYLDVEKRDMGTIFVSVQLKMSENKGAPIYGGGLIYRFQKDTKCYYAFILNNEKQVSLYEKNENGTFILHFSRISRLVEPHEYNWLGIACDADKMYFFVNNGLVITRPSTLGTGGTGLLAMGCGNFSFDNLSLYFTPPRFVHDRTIRVVAT